MTKQIRYLPLRLLLGLLLLVGVAAPARSDLTNSSSAATQTNRFQLKPGPDDGKIAFVTAVLLSRMHYSQQPFDDTISSKFLDSYIESLDSQHVHFLQSDLDDFEHYRTNLDNLTIIPRRQSADVSPAYEILGRFVERLQQHVAYIDELVKTEKFEFNTDERITVDRRDAPYPKDLNEAKELWRQRLRLEYLTEKLGIETAAKTNKSSVADEGGSSPKPQRDQIVETLTRRWHRTLKFVSDWNNDDVMGVYLTSLAHVYDPHSDYMNRAEMENFRISMNLQLFGIGAELRSEDGYCKIMRLLPGGPAAKSGKIKEGDRIIAVAQGDQPPVDVVDMNLTKAVQLIRGEKGTEVRLKLIPAMATSPQKEVILTRDEIQLDDQAAKGKIFDLPAFKEQSGAKTIRLGYIDLPSFYAPMDFGAKPGDIAGDTGGGAGGAPHSTSGDVAKLLNKFKGENVRGVILDLRRNGGGSLDEAIKLTGLFIKDGPVVQVKTPGSNGRIQVDSDEDPSITYEGPLIVLTSKFSASASEIVAGALQDYGRAIIVGDASTHGKGTVQTVSDLSQFIHSPDADAARPDEFGDLKVTIRKFYRASGASTQKKGVMPDIVLPSRWNYATNVGETALENPLEWDTIESAKYEKLNLVQPYLSELLRRSNERVSTNQDFDFVRQDIEEFRKLQADKTVSLNEQERLKEIREADARQKAWEKERLAHNNSNQKVYEITLKQAVLPGLPAPIQNTNLLAASGSVNAAVPVTTNAVSAAAAASSDTEDELTDKLPTVDVDLDEAEHIMADYLSLLPKDSPLLAKQSDGSIDSR